MLEQLRIRQFILVDEWVINFEKGLNVISGESGSGKSAIIQAIDLLTGGKAVKDKVRTGAQQSTIEGIFSPICPQIEDILNDAGIESDDTLIIRRTVSKEGKSRSFVNNCSVTIALLKQLAPLLFDPINQHASVQLQSSAKHRDLLDEFGGYKSLLEEYQNAYLHFQKLEKELQALLKEANLRQHQAKEIEKQLEDLDRAQLEPGEEQVLYEEYKSLTEKKDSCEKIQELLRIFDQPIDNGFNFSQSLKQNINYLNHHIEAVPELEEILLSLVKALPEIEDAHYSLQRLANQYYQDPHRESQLHERLSLIHRLSKQFLCSDADQLLTIHEKLAEELDSLADKDQRQEELILLVPESKQSLTNLGSLLTDKRKKAAAKLIIQSTQILKQLNMEHSSIGINMISISPSNLGFEGIDMTLKANCGEKEVSLKNAASGGEMARVLLSIKLASHITNTYQTMILDEIDASIGGKTAKKMALLIKKRAQNQQIICITHFAQVAEEADHHLCIEKNTKDSRTFASFKTLNKDQRKKELHRMIGDSSRITFQNDLAEKN